MFYWPLHCPLKSLANLFLLVGKVGILGELYPFAGNRNNIIVPNSCRTGATAWAILVRGHILPGIHRFPLLIIINFSRRLSYSQDVLWTLVAEMTFFLALETEAICGIRFPGLIIPALAVVLCNTRLQRPAEHLQRRVSKVEVMQSNKQEVH